MYLHAMSAFSLLRQTYYDIEHLAKYMYCVVKHIYRKRKMRLQNFIYLRVVCLSSFRLESKRPIN
jgi:hypothetical protein